LGSARSEVIAARLREMRSALGLAAVPLVATVLVGMLLLPREAIPDALPLPVPDPFALQQAFEVDRALAAKARSTPLPGVVRALGSTLRDFHTLEVTGAQPADLAKARHAIDNALIDVESVGDEPLLELRAVQLEGFVAEIERFASSGVESPELDALAGGFVRSMRAEGWCDGHRFILTPPELRAIFKEMWSSVLGLEDKPPFALTLDETRALFALRLSRPRLPARVRDAIALSWPGAKDERACRALVQSEHRALERWSLDHIDRIAAVDPLYPAAYARGVARLRGGSVEAAASSFREWLSVHPDGALALRARSYLRLATRAGQVE
jgi:hypothetical protein